MDSMDFMDMMDGVIQSAMRYEILKAHGTHCTMCCLPSEASGEGGSVLHCPHYAALRNVLCQPTITKAEFGRAKKIPQPTSDWRIEKTLA